MTGSHRPFVAMALSAALGVGSVHSAMGQFPSSAAKGTVASSEVEQVGFFGKRKRVCDPCRIPTTIPAEPEAKPAPSAKAPEVAEPKPGEPPRAAELPPAAEAPAPEPQVPEEPLSPSDDPFAGSFDVAAADSVLAPNMLGDFAGTVFAAAPPEPTPTGEGLTPAENAQTRTVTRYKVADFNSPMPKTRLLYNFNYFGDAFQAGGKVYRNFLGGEYAFFDNMMSVELRGSLNTFREFEGATDTTEFGDLRSVFKAVFYRNESTILTTGFGMNWPTGGLPAGVPGVYAITPYVGYLFMPSGSSLFLQGFQQLDIPFHADDQLLMHTDIGLGYWLRPYDPSRTISGIAPAIELHLYTPIGDSPAGDLLGLRYNDVLNLTLGSAIFVGRNLQLGVGLGIPVSNIKDYDIEAQFHGEWRFGGNGSRAIPNIY